MFKSLSHIMMWTNDINRAMQFYTEKLGCKVNFEALPHYASLRHEKSGVGLALHPSNDGKEVGTGPMPYFKVDNVDATLKELAGKGIKVGKPQTEGSHKFATFWDSEGNALGIQQ